MEGPVRSMSRIPTDLPWSESARASWRVTEDFPTPPLPDSTCETALLGTDWKQMDNAVYC